jgi:hypothetical protein
MGFVLLIQTGYVRPVLTLFLILADTEGAVLKFCRSLQTRIDQGDGFYPEANEIV